MKDRSRRVHSSQPADRAMVVDISTLADQVQAGETVVAPSVEACGELLAELARRGHVRQGSAWSGNTFTISVGPQRPERID